MEVGGGLDLTLSLEAKFGERSGQVHKIRGEKPGEFRHHKTQKLGKSPNFGVGSEIKRAKFGLFVTYIFGGRRQDLGLQQEFQRQILGPSPRRPNMEVPSWAIGLLWHNFSLSYKYGDTCNKFQCTLVGKKALSACMTNLDRQA